MSIHDEVNSDLQPKDRDVIALKIHPYTYIFNVKYEKIKHNDDHNNNNMINCQKKNLSG